MTNEETEKPSSYSLNFEFNALLLFLSIFDYNLGFSLVFKKNISPAVTILFFVPSALIFMKFKRKMENNRKGRRVKRGRIS
jgi:hypothetical protein